MATLLKVSTWPVEKVTPYKNNPRRNDGATKTVAESAALGTSVRR
jgi:hypothetical protein